MKSSDAQKRLPAIFLVIVLLFQICGFYVQADELTDTEKQLEEKKNNYTNQQSELEKKKAEEGTLAQQYEAIRGQLGGLQIEYDRKVAELTAKEEALNRLIAEAEEKETLLEERQELIGLRIRSLYKKTQNPPIISFLSDNELASVAEDYTYRTKTLEEDRRNAIALGIEIDALLIEKQNNEQLKVSLEQEKANLIASIKQTQQNMIYTNSQLSNNKSTQNQLVQQLAGLQNEISSLTQKQQEILAAKAAAAAAKNTVGNSEQAWTPITEAALCGSGFYSLWTYGYPHRVGMNQYGAYGRALAGQTYSQILSAYYANTTLEKVNTDALQIRVEGNDEQGRYVNEVMSFEDKYLLGMAEMPSSWSLEAQKAQAVAARTYALQYTQDGNKPICPNQNCQVYNMDKVTNPAAALWHQAVKETKGMVLKSGGTYISAWYASTAGGATLSSEEVWGGYRAYALSMADVDGAGKAYDGPDHGNSPWFHKAWGDKACLTKAEMTDLLNAALLPDSYKEHLSSAANGGYTPEEVLTTLVSEGIAPITDITTVTATVGIKNTTALTVMSAEGSRSLDPAHFKLAYNLRSPGTNAIWTTKYDIQTS